MKSDTVSYSPEYFMKKAAKLGCLSAEKTWNRFKNMERQDLLSFYKAAEKLEFSDENYIGWLERKYNNI